MWGARDVIFQTGVPACVAMAARRFAADISGTTAIEYALLGVLIAVAIVAAVNQVGDGVKPLYERLVGIYGN